MKLYVFIVNLWVNWNLQWCRIVVYFIQSPAALQSMPAVSVHCLCVRNYIMFGITVLTVYLYISSGAQQNDMNIRIILLGTHRSAKCIHVFEVLTPVLQPIANFLFVHVLLVKILYQARFCLPISYPAILFTMLMCFF